MNYKHYKDILNIGNLPIPIKEYFLNFFNLDNYKIIKFFPKIGLNNFKKRIDSINLLFKTIKIYINIIKIIDLDINSWIIRDYSKINLFYNLCANIFNIRKYIKNNSNYNIIFSGDGFICFKDILTMSMRGINSCMNWYSTSSRALIGSCIDPYCAIIYLTDNTNIKYGQTMLYRSVVRYVKHPKLGPCLYIDHAYHNNDKASRCNNYIETLFAITLMSQTNLPVIFNIFKYSSTLNDLITKIIVSKFTIPESNIVNSLPPSYLSYRDTKIQYKN